MADMFKILVINPGSTSTKVALYQNDQPIVEENISHGVSELAALNSVDDHCSYRRGFIENFITGNGLELSELSAIAARGGILKPLVSGVYRINEKMVSELGGNIERASNLAEIIAKSVSRRINSEQGSATLERAGNLAAAVTESIAKGFNMVKQRVIGLTGKVEHASNLAAIIAYKMSQTLEIPAYIVDPVVVDEMSEISKLSGTPLLPRRALWHALNQKACVRKAAKQIGKDRSEATFIVAHLGGGVSVALHKNGRAVDVNNALAGTGPFSPERCSSLPTLDLIDFCYSGRYSHEEMRRNVKGGGGMVAYVGTSDMRRLNEMIDLGDTKAKLVFDAFCYQVAKEIGSLAAAAKGKVDAVVLTGGIANDSRFCQTVKEYVGFIAPVLIFAGEGEMQALAEGVARVLMAEEESREYS